LEYRDSLPDATAAFMAYFRLTTHCCCKPKYPEPITWDLIEKFLGAPPYEVIPLLKEVLA
jgi:hypothetical protein